MKTKVSRPMGTELATVEPSYIYLAALREGTDCGPSAYAIFQGGAEPWERIKEFDGGDRIELCWRGLVYIAAKRIPEGESAFVFSNEATFCHQFSGKAPVATPMERTLKDRVFELIDKRNLNICVTFIPPTRNIAWGLLQPRLNRY